MHHQSSLVSSKMPSNFGSTHLNGFQENTTTPAMKVTAASSEGGSMSRKSQIWKLCYGILIAASNSACSQTSSAHLQKCFGIFFSIYHLLSSYSYCVEYSFSYHKHRKFAVDEEFLLDSSSSNIRNVYFWDSVLFCCKIERKATFLSSNFKQSIPPLVTSPCFWRTQVLEKTTLAEIYSHNPSCIMKSARCNHKGNPCICMTAIRIITATGAKTTTGVTRAAGATIITRATAVSKNCRL